MAAGEHAKLALMYSSQGLDWPRPEHLLATHSTFWYWGRAALNGLTHTLSFFLLPDCLLAKYSAHYFSLSTFHATRVSLSLSCRSLPSQRSTCPLFLPSLPEDIGDVRVQAEDPDDQRRRDQDKRPGHIPRSLTQPRCHSADQPHAGPAPLQLLLFQGLFEQQKGEIFVRSTKDSCCGSTEAPSHVRSPGSGFLARCSSGPEIWEPHPLRWRVLTSSAPPPIEATTEVLSEIWPENSIY